MNRKTLIFAKKVNTHLKWALRVMPDLEHEDDKQNHDNDKQIKDLRPDQLVPLAIGNERQDFISRKLYLKHIIREALEEAESTNIKISRHQSFVWRVASNFLHEVETLPSKLRADKPETTALQTIILIGRQCLDHMAKKNIIEDLGSKALELLDELEYKNWQQVVASDSNALLDKKTQAAR